MPKTVAVIFDVDFTLISPGERFQARGYQRTCARYGIAIDPDRFDDAVAGAAGLLHAADPLYDPQVFINYTCRIIELMGGAGPRVAEVARDIHDDWSANQYFDLYDDVAVTLRHLQVTGVRVGLISNTNRSLEAFQDHFELHGLIAASLSSSDHGYMKPHASIFHAALEQLRAEPAEAVMVGDSLQHDVRGAEAVGMRAVLLDRAGTSGRVDVTVIRTLRDLPALLE